MPEITTIVFLVGLGLIVVAVVGGGIEIKEMKVGSLNKSSRIFCALFGLIFMIVPVWHPESIRGVAAEKRSFGEQSPNAPAPGVRTAAETGISKAQPGSAAAPVTFAEMNGILEVVESYFSQDRPTRLAAQRSFYEKWRNNPTAVELLVDRSNLDVKNVCSVYNALSTINNIIPPFSPSPSLTAKILSLSRNASDNSVDTSRVALELQRKLR